MILLGIETSGKTASVAVCNEEIVLSQSSIYTKLTHSQVILPLCNDVLKNAGLTLNEIDALAVSKGPGSYTGLRIGISAVKAMCFALDKPCIGISTLESLAYNLLGFKGIICSVMAARSDLLYTALFEGNGSNITRLSDDSILPESEVIKNITETDKDVILTGDGVLGLIEKELFKDISRAVYAPPHLRLQLASSLCYTGFIKGKPEFIDPEMLNAEYLQITKAEQDLKHT